MKMYTISTKTYKALAADYAAAFKDIKPTGPTTTASLAEALEPHKVHILKQRERGLSWEQIAGGMAGPLINLKVSGSALRKLFGPGESAQKSASKPSNLSAVAARPTTAPATPSSATPPTAPATPARRRLLLDPVTNLPITPP